MNRKAIVKATVSLISIIIVSSTFLFYPLVMLSVAIIIFLLIIGRAAFLGLYDYFDGLDKKKAFKEKQEHYRDSFLNLDDSKCKVPTYGGRQIPPRPRKGR